MRNTSLREKLSDAAGWVMVGCGLVAVIVITAVQTSIDNAVGAGLLFVGLLAGAFLSTLVHELGHAAGAWAVGWRVWIISVMGVVLRRGHGLRLSAKYSHDVGGYVLASPPDDAHDSRWRSIAFSAGGPLASVLTGPLFLAWLILAPREAWATTPIGAGLYAAILGFSIAGCVSAMMTLWPSRGRDGHANDMGMILGAMFMRDPSADVRGVAWAWALFEHGAEPEAWPRWMHESIERSARNPWASPAAPLLAFLCAVQSGDDAAARDLARRCPHGVGKLMRGYVHAYFDKDPQAAALELVGVELDPREETPLLLYSFVSAHIAALKGDAEGAQRAFAAIANKLHADGPKPYWDRLLAHAV